MTSERKFRLSTGEAVEQLAQNVFVVLQTNELLTRITTSDAFAEVLWGKRRQPKKGTVVQD